jgi:hypothetical protein
VVSEIHACLAARRDSLLAAGIPLEKICLDPGIGFGKTHAHNRELMAHAARFLDLGAPILVGHSRKGFIGKSIEQALGRPATGYELDAATAESLNQRITRRRTKTERFRFLGREHRERRRPGSLRSGGGLLAGGGIPQGVYRQSLLLSARRSAHGRCTLRIPRAAPAACRPGTTPPLRASPAREDTAPQDRLREPRELAGVARPRRAARAGLRRGGTPRLPRVRHPLLWIRTRSLHGLRPGFCHRSPAEPGSAERGHGWPALPMASPTGARATVGDLRAEAITGFSRRIGLRPSPLSR